MKADKRMSYSTLTIPTPKGCDECPCMSGIAMPFVACGATGSTIRDISKKLKNCPLRPTGEKNEESKDKP